MVSDTLLRSLDLALRSAGNRRNQTQIEVNDLRRAVTTAEANFQRAQTQETNATIRNDQKQAEHKELLDYYNGLADKSDLGAILEQIETCAAEQRDTNRLLGESREIRMQRYSELEKAKTDLAVAESRLVDATKEWHRMFAQVAEARNGR